MYTFLIALKPKSGETWPWVADLNRPDDLLPLHYEGHFNLQIEPLLKTYDLRQYGRLLGEALFQGNLRDAFTNALAQARQQGWLRVQLLIDKSAQELRQLHWERVLVPIDGRWEFLALNQSTPFSLYLTSRSDRRFPPLSSSKLSMLLVTANPQNLEDYSLANFDTTATLDSLSKALGDMPVLVLANKSKSAPARGVSDLPTIDSICQSLTEESYPLLHLVCHGRVIESSGETALYLSGADGQVVPLDGSTWIERLALLKNLPYLVFLSTCESADPRAESGLGGLAQRMVRELGIPAVLAMTGKVSIATVQALVDPFYRSLVKHGQADRALSEALASVAERSDFTMPALYTRLRDGQLFEQERLVASEPVGGVGGDQYDLSGDFQGATIYIKSDVKFDQADERIKPVEHKPFEPEMVLIPPGSFLMGRDEAPGVPPNETPKAHIELPAYYIGTYPVTNREYAEYVRQTGITAPIELGWERRRPAKNQLKLPVLGVTWQEAVDYCAWLKEQTGRNYTLPNEAQWERAARGDDERLYPWGDDWEEGRSNQGNSRIAAVAAFSAQSKSGLYDLVGNVLQWTSTLWGEKRLEADFSYPWQPDDERDDLNANNQVRRVLRGSAYSDSHTECTCTARRSFLPAERGQPGKRHGFRVVRSA
jgi:formylglycine-generating enzyme required for sulfatase activity